MPRAPLPLLLLASGALLAGCASNHSKKSIVARDPLADRTAYLERRSEELIRRGVPKDVALSRASGEWFAQTENRVSRREADRRAEQQILNAQLERMQRAGN